MIQDYDWSRLAALGYPADLAERMKSDYAEPDIQQGRVHGGGKRRPVITGPSAGSPSFAEGEDETFDFTRCVRPNGSAYGTRGKCRKGTEEAKKAGEAVSKGDKGARLPRGVNADQVKFAKGLVEDYAGVSDPKKKVQAGKLALAAVLAAEKGDHAKLAEAQFKLFKMGNPYVKDLLDDESQMEYERFQRRLAERMPAPKEKEFAKGVPWPENPLFRSHLESLDPGERKELAKEYKRLKKMDAQDVPDEASNATMNMPVFRDRPGKADDSDLDEFLMGRNAARFTSWVTGSPEYEQEPWNYSEIERKRRPFALGYPQQTYDR